jgi:hypothetical protein
MQSNNVNDDERDLKESKPMSILYEANSDTLPENITLGDMMDRTPAPLRRANRNYKQSLEEDDDEEMWKFCDEVSSRGTYGMTRQASDADGSLTKKNKSLSDAEVKGRKKEKALKYYAVKVGKKRGIYGDWDSAKEQISGYPGGTCKKFNIMEKNRFTKEILPILFKHQNFPSFVR